jgi:hypothetical protein
MHIVWHVRRQAGLGFAVFPSPLARVYNWVERYGRQDKARAVARIGKSRTLAAALEVELAGHFDNSPF